MCTGLSWSPAQLPSPSFPAGTPRGLGPRCSVTVLSLLLWPVLLSLPLPSGAALLLCLPLAGLGFGAWVHPGMAFPDPRVRASPYYHPQMLPGRFCIWPLETSKAGLPPSLLWGRHQPRAMLAVPVSAPTLGVKPPPGVLGSVPSTLMLADADLCPSGPQPLALDLPRHCCPLLCPPHGSVTTVAAAGGGDRI